MPVSFTIQCPLCNDAVDKLVYRFHLGSERQVIERIKQTNPAWTESDGVCSRCIDYYHTEILIQQRVLPEIGPYFPVKSADDFIILPSGLRMDADPRFTGKGVTICFIDSGFYPHPDLKGYKNRIKVIVDITNPFRDPSGFYQPFSENWHGMMTTVVCAGDGCQSGGLYKGIASEAELVLLKVQDDEGNISNKNIEEALRWILNNHELYGIRIVNISVGGDNSTTSAGPINELAQELEKRNITILAAAGNDEHGSIRTPANSAHVITVGGTDDDNKPGSQKKLYHSSFGEIEENILKPELIAPAIWIAAPILPGSEEHKESIRLHELLHLPDDLLQQQITELPQELRKKVSFKDEVPLRQSIVNRIQARKYISPHYMHGDGTSFAAPLVCAVIAQLLEANPQLAPRDIRHALFSTASRLDGLPAERQGYGTVQASRAILHVLKNRPNHPESPYIDNKRNTIVFSLQNDHAFRVSLCGSFNGWSRDMLPLEAGRNGLWQIEMPMLAPGRYSYKFFMNDTTWLEDIENPFREPDGLNGFNSILIIDGKIN